MHAVIFEVTRFVCKLVIGDVDVFFSLYFLWLVFPGWVQFLMHFQDHYCFSSLCFFFLKMFEFLTDECVLDHNERIRSIQIDKNFITRDLRRTRSKIQTFSIMRVQNKILLQNFFFF